VRDLVPARQSKYSGFSQFRFRHLHPIGQPWEAGPGLVQVGDEIPAMLVVGRPKSENSNINKPMLERTASHGFRNAFENKSR